MRVRKSTEAAVILMLLTIFWRASAPKVPFYNLTQFSSVLAADFSTSASSNSWQNARLIRTLPPTGSFLGLSPDNQTLATYRRGFQTSTDGQVDAPTNENSITLSNINTGQVIRTLSYNSPSDIQSFVFSPNKQIVASSSYSGETLTIKLWNVRTGEEIQTLRRLVKPKRTQNTEIEYPDNSVIAFSPDGRSLISISTEDPTIQVWDVSSKSMVTKENNGRSLVSNSLNQGTLRFNITGHSDNITAFAFSPNGHLLASASIDETIKLWNLKTGKLIYSLKAGISRDSKLVISPDSRLIISVENEFNQLENNKIKLWNLKNGKLVRTIPVQGIINYIRFSSDAKKVINIVNSPFISYRIQIWNALTGKLIHRSQEIGDLKNTTTSIAISPDDKTYAIAGDDYKQFQVRDLMRNKTLVNFATQEDWVNYTADGKNLVTGGKEGIKIWR